jgi:hypothetical protein
MDAKAILGGDAEDDPQPVLRVPVQGRRDL